MKIRSAVITGIKQVCLTEREIEPNEDEVLVKTHSASICLAELQMYRKGYSYPGVPLSFPVYPGHEGGGIVVKVGAMVHEYKEGDKVSCMHDGRTFSGVMPGTMSEYWAVRPIDLVPVPAEMDMDLASLVEAFNPFIAVVFHSGVKLGDLVCVTGANFIGQIVAQGMKKSGAMEVTVIDDRDFHLSMAKKLGADYIINSTKVDACKTAMAITGGKGFDVVAQTAAYTDPTVEEYMNLAGELVRPWGTLIFQGDFLHPVTLKNIHRWHRESINVRSLGWRHQDPLLVQAQSSVYLRPLQHELVQVRPLITATFSLDKIEEAFKLADEDPDQLKIIIKP